MDSQAITNPFKYLYENINIDICRGISTNLIQSNILEICSNYCLSSNCTFENSLQILKIEDKAVSSTQSKNVYTEETMIEDSLNCLRDKKKVEYIHDYQSLKSNDTLGVVRCNDEIIAISDCAEEEKYNSYSSCYSSDKLISNSLEFHENYDLYKITENRNSKLTRWGYRQDKFLWQRLKELKEISKERYDFITSANLIDIESNRGFLYAFSFNCHWKGTTENFLKRIQKILHKNRFSFRDRKRLKTLFRKGISAQNIDLNKIAKEFPGKEISQILCEIENIKSEYKIMKNINIQENVKNFR